MPKLDGTGPLGAGSRTGWGLGRCWASVGRGLTALRGALQGVGGGGMPRGGGRGSRFGGGGFRGMQRPFPDRLSPSSPDESETLKAALAAAEEQIAAMKARLEELEKGSQAR